MINILVSIIGYDSWFYISHLILHTQYFYFYHKEHHRNIINLTFLDTYTGHILEGPFQGIGIFLPYLFNLSMTVSEIIIVLLIVNIRGMMRHDYRCIWLIGDHHLLHHQYYNCNYGEYWIDYIFNTLKDN
jgi:sterol desaturase/sphingolipid hydroxylase (fatty acid hydroxylase superfamily)